jgi:hypothetical protein
VEKSLIATILLAIVFAPTLAVSDWDVDESIELDGEAKEALAEFRANGPSVYAAT